MKAPALRGVSDSIRRQRLPEAAPTADIGEHARMLRARLSAGSPRAAAIRRASHRAELKRTQVASFP